MTSEIQEAIALQPNNKIKLLYGVRTTDDGKQYQAVCTREQMMLSNSAGANAIARLERDLTNAKNNGSFSNIDYRVQELQEYSVESTNLSTPTESVSAMPWD